MSSSEVKMYRQKERKKNNILTLPIVDATCVLAQPIMALKQN